MRYANPPDEGNRPAVCLFARGQQTPAIPCRTLAGTPNDYRGSNLSGSHGPV